MLMREKAEWKKFVHTTCNSQSTSQLQHSTARHSPSLVMIINFVLDSTGLISSKKVS